MPETTLAPARAAQRQTDYAVDIIIPAFNEADRIAATVRAASGIGARRVIVVDDGSRDDTALRAAAEGAEVIRLPRNQGKGAALTAGLAASSGDILVLLDADTGASAREASRLIEPLAAGQADVAIAHFPPVGGGGGFGLVKGLARFGIRRLSGLDVQSPLSGQRALRREVWRHLGGIAAGFGAEVAMTITVARAGFRVVEVPVTMTHRELGRSWRGFVHRGVEFWHVGRALWRCARGRTR